MFGIVQFTGAVKVQDDTKHIGIAIEEVFSRVFVVEEFLLI